MNLKKMRLAAGLTQGQLAEAAGTTLQIVSYFECGRRDINNAKLSTLLSFAEALGCRIQDILDDQDLIDKCSRNSL